ncbi:MAG: nucleoside hydrolase, partial [Actinomycetota bacterium]|nr:nucleoside hydrolase [Actinomycetota bacterium]
MAVTTVAGNHTLDNVTANALSVARVIGLSGIPIARGCAWPLVRAQELAEGIHGGSGMDGPR